MESQTAVQAPITQPFLGAFDLFRPSIKAILLNIKAFALLAVIPIMFMVASVPFALLGDAMNIDALKVAFAAVSLIVGIIGIVLFVMVAPAIFLTQLQSVRGKVVDPMAMFKESRKFFWRFYGVSILQTLIFAVSFVALVVPVLFAMHRFMLAQYFVFEHKAGVIEALKMSNAAAKAYSSPMWGLVGVVVLMNLLSIVPFLAFPAGVASVLYALAPAIRYNEIKTAEKALEKETKAPKPVTV